MTTFERVVGLAGALVVLTLILAGHGAGIVVAYTPFILVITGSMWWRSRGNR